LSCDGCFKTCYEDVLSTAFQAFSDISQTDEHHLKGGKEEESLWASFGFIYKPPTIYILKAVGLPVCSALSAEFFMTLNIHEGRDGWPECVAIAVVLGCSKRVFSTCDDCLGSAQSVFTLRHTKDRTCGLLLRQWKTSGLGKPDLGQFRFIKKNPPARLEPLGTDPHFHG